MFNRLSRFDRFCFHFGLFLLNLLGFHCYLLCGFLCLFSNYFFLCCLSLYYYFLGLCLFYWTLFDDFFNWLYFGYYFLGNFLRFNNCLLFLFLYHILNFLVLLFKEYIIFWQCLMIKYIVKNNEIN